MTFCFVMIRRSPRISRPETLFPDTPLFRALYPARASRPRRRRRAGREPEAIIRDLGELSEGSAIVHVDDGVGRYRGLVTLEAGGQPEIGRASRRERGGPDV